MDPSDFNRWPRKELQGPRPSPLKVRKDSYKIKKPPIAPQPPQQQPQQEAQPRAPVIIYTVSPKVIHTNPNDFMDLVQRLTGCSSSSTATSSSYSSSSRTAITTTTTGMISNFPQTDNSGAISPAARYATIERTRSPDGKIKQQIKETNMGFVEGIEMDHPVERTSFFPGILSPGPTTLPQISPSFFSPLSDPNSISFFHDLSPVLHGNKNFMEGSFMPSPSSFVSPYMPSPTTPSIDLFNNFFDF